MNSRQRTEMVTLHGSQGVIDDHAAEIPGVANAGAKKELDSILAELDTHVTAQSQSTVAALAATQTHYAARRKLVYEHMASIVAVAKAKEAKVPELGVLRMPKQNARIQQVLTTAENMANAVAPHEAVFVTAGLPADFVKQLQDSAAATLASLNERDGNVAKLVGAGVGIRTLLAEGRRQVVVLDKLMQVALPSDSSLLATWRQVKRVPKPTVASSAAGAATAVASAVPAAAASAPSTATPPATGAAPAAAPQAASATAGAA